MKKSRLSKSLGIVLLAGFSLLSVQSMAFAADPSAAVPPKPQAAAPAFQDPKLLDGDCAKCHRKPPADIAAAGAKHKTAVGCQDCHNGHPPLAAKSIPLCSQCHEGKPHYKLAACKSCHSNPHAPLTIKFGKNVTDACVSCHAGQIVKLRDNKSRHTALFCSTCHDTHGKIPDCTQCHKAHSPEQTNADCKKCHQAHMPKNVVYDDKTPSRDCAGCHRKAYDLLTASTFKHKNLSCVACHQAKHKMVPQCQSCHGTPHPAAMLAQFPKCGFCHSIAHDLNSYKNAPSPKVSTAPAPAAATKTGPTKKQPRKQ